MKNKAHLTKQELSSPPPSSTSWVQREGGAEIALMLEKDRVKYNKNKPLNSLSKSVLLVNINNNKTEIFFSIAKMCRVFKKQRFTR
jgi:hypothetical protein